MEENSMQSIDRLRVYVYLDESGNIHQNSNTDYFAIGGFFVLNIGNAKDKVIHKYKKINKKQKQKRGIDLRSELKTRDMHQEEKIKLFEEVQSIDHFYGCSIVFEKRHMKKHISNCNIFFNYGVKVLFKDVIIPLLPTDISFEFIISIDNRNISVGDLSDLSKFLNTTFCYSNYTFDVTYYDSSTNYGIQLADLIVNTFYMRAKNNEFIRPVIDVLDVSKFRLGIFPGHCRLGRGKKIEIILGEIDM